MIAGQIRKQSRKIDPHVIHTSIKVVNQYKIIPVESKRQEDQEEGGTRQGQKDAKKMVKDLQ